MIQNQRQIYVCLHVSLVGVFVRWFVCADWFKHLMTVWPCQQHIAALKSEIKTCPNESKKPLRQVSWAFSALIRARKYSQRKLLRELLSAGFQGKMDFMYLPIDPRTRASRGFAFCNFTSPQARSKKESGWSNGPNQKPEMLLVPICSGLACKAYKILHMYIICY